MNDSYNMEPHQDNAMDLVEVINILWRKKILIISHSIASALIAIVVSINMPDIYRSYALLAPVQQQDSGLGGMKSQLGGLAGLAGISLGGGAMDNTDLGLELLQSYQFFERFAQKQNVLVPLMASEGWDREQNTLILDPDKYNQATKTWVRTPKPPRGIVPSLQEAHEEFLKLIEIDQDIETGFITVSIEHYSPYLAKQWVDSIVEQINMDVKDIKVKEAENSIAYLNEQVANTQLTDLKMGIFELIQSQIEKIMIANSRQEYLFQTIQPAQIKELKEKPRRAMIVILATVLGGFIGIFIAFLMNVNEKRKK